MPGAERDLAYLAGIVALIVIGPGRLSLDLLLGIEPTEATSEPAPAYAT